MASFEVTLYGQFWVTPEAAEPDLFIPFGPVNVIVALGIAAPEGSSTWPRKPAPAEPWPSSDAVTASHKPMNLRARIAESNYGEGFGPFHQKTHKRARNRHEWASITSQEPMAAPRAHWPVPNDLAFRERRALARSPLSTLRL